MARFFYTDPLAAAWMAKHFGMRFEFADDDEGGYYEPEKNEFADHINGEWPRPAYIHPDSLHLLEPKVGDGLWFPEAIEPYRLCRENEDDLSKLHMTFTRYKITTGDCRITRRDGIAFMWPQSEAA